nr:hypothetical protein [Carnobacterium maltaromaticum]
MIRNFHFDFAQVNWLFKGREINIKMENIIFSSIDKINNQVSVKVGKNFISESEYYYDFSGNLLFELHKMNGEIKWCHNGELFKQTVLNIENIGFYTNKGIILIMYKANENEAFFVDLKNEFSHEINKPKGFQLAYFEETKNNILIVCNGDTEKTDKFGRYQKNFILDISTGELQENGIAY